MDLKPPVKWVGGKRQLLHEIIPLIKLIRPRFTTYVEPFLGGGAVLFSLRPSKAIVNDINSDLIELYLAVRNNTDALIAALEIHASNHCEEYYYRIRALDRTEQYQSMDTVERAARLIYLNRTCFNGLYRVNAAGYFNVPYGRYKNPNIVNESNIRSLGKYLQSNDIIFCNENYLSVIDRLDRKKFVYLDPPYMPISDSSSFTGYTEGGFDYEHQVALRDACNELRQRKIAFIESNSDCEAIRELYKEFSIKTVQAKRNVNSVGSKRGEINEVLIYYAPEE